MSSVWRFISAFLLGVPEALIQAGCVRNQMLDVERELK
jgi:hypothetical protein